MTIRTAPRSNRLRNLTAAALFVLATGTPAAALAGPIGPGDISDRPQDPTCHLPQGCDDKPDDKAPPPADEDDCDNPIQCDLTAPEPGDDCPQISCDLTSNPGDEDDDSDDDSDVDAGDTITANPDFTG